MLLQEYPLKDKYNCTDRRAYTCTSVLIFPFKYLKEVQGNDYGLTNKRPLISIRLNFFSLDVTEYSIRNIQMG